MILFSLLVLVGFTKSLQYLVVEYLQRRLYAKITAIIALAYEVDDMENDLKLEHRANRYFDIILIHKSLAFIVTDVLSVALQTFIGLILLSLYHPYFIVFGFLILLSIAIPLYLFGRSGKESATEESNRKYEVADYLKSLALKYHQGEPISQYNTTDNQINYFLSGRSRHFRTLFAQNITYMALYAILNALLLALGGFLVIKNQLSLGQLVAAEIVVNAILGHFMYALKYLESFYDVYAASHKVYPFYLSLERLADKRKLDWQLTDSSPPIGRPIQEMESSKKIFTPPNFKKFSLYLGGVAFLVLLFLVLVPWQQFSRGTGNVVALNPNDRVQSITAPLDGIVEEWLVQDGQFVRKGEVIVKVMDNDPNYLVRLEAKRDAAIAEFQAAKEASDTGRLNFHRQEKLRDEGLSSSKEFELAKIKYKKLLAEESAAAANLAQTEVELARQQQQDIIAPRAGQIRRILVGSGQTKVNMGEPLVEFVPETNQQAVELFIDGMDLPLVHNGRHVRLQFEGWPAIQFTGWPSVSIGSFGGLVKVVDPSVNNNGLFRILVVPDPEDPNPWPSDQFIRQGTRVVGIINLDIVTIGYELWRQINGFPKSMGESPQYHSTGGNKK